MSVLGGGVHLERFPGLCGVVRAVKGGFFFHTSGEDLPPGGQLRKKPCGSCGSP